jgi:pimeloyl-ACP methyl ester carboxylesterase
MPLDSRSSRLAVGGKEKAATAQRGETPEASKKAVILVHGLWMKGWVLGLQRRWFARCGYRPYLFSYASISRPLDENAEELARFIATVPEPRLYLVGHSLGGIVLLHTLKKFCDPRILRIVLLGTPYVDCKAARQVGKKRFGRFLLGKSLTQWVEGKKPRWQGKPQLGVVAGSRKFGLGMFFTRFDGINDGVVALEETKVPGMTAHIVLHVGHSEMMFSRAVVKAACRFFKEGRF